MSAHTRMNGGRVELQLEVSDTGISIPQNKNGQVFEKFTQLGGVAGACNEGVGLGLSITLSLVELMDGRLDVRSAEGESSSFSPLLPLEKVDAAAMIGTTDASPVPTRQPQNRHQRR